MVRSMVLLMLIPAALVAAGDFDREQIEQRIAPVGKVHIEAGKSPQSKSEEKTQVVEHKAPGQDVYEQYCVTCHRDGVAGAPKFRDAGDWRARLAKQNLDSLTASAIHGLNAMPAKGTCQECTDADIKAAISYMVPQ